MVAVQWRGRRFSLLYRKGLELIRKVGRASHLEGSS